MKRRYGWVRDLPDARDRLRLHVAYAIAAALPALVDLSGQCPPVYNQGQLGSCTGNAIAAAMEYSAGKQGLGFVAPSRLFIYYNERDLEGTVQSDSGAQIRDGIKSVAQFGVCPESEWPYDESQFAVRPPQSCYDDARKDLALKYERVVQDLDTIRSTLAGDEPVVFGFQCYQGLESSGAAQTGVVPAPLWFERPIGGHAVMLTGYDDATQRFKFRNSWGPDWGDGGYGYLPYGYVTSQLASDFWVITLVGQQSATSVAA